MADIPKAYEAKNYEDDIYARWEASGFFTPENLPDWKKRTPYTIMLPLPNATGTLHVGHAMMLALEDLLVRFARMRGRRALWVPGTDHAAIATQNKVEKILWQEEKKTRHDLGREEMLRRIDEFVKNSQATIHLQLRKMGSSLDWTREAFPLDAPRALAVRTLFKKMYDDGLIYRGKRVVNWCPRCASTLSDDELIYKTQKTKLFYFKYAADFPLTIATTQPESKLGDTAVAVHPSDERYKALLGKHFSVAFGGAGGVELSLQVIGDRGVEKDFGTGAVGVTPAHSLVDYGMAQAHDLPLVEVIGDDGLMTAGAGVDYAGLTAHEARARVVAWLKQENLIEKVEEVEQNLPICYRCEHEINPLPKLQWFVGVNKPFEFTAANKKSLAGLKNKQAVTLKEVMQRVVTEGEIKIIPERFAKNYFHWIDNLRDWCISRQIWYGHRIPVWYCQRCTNAVVAVETPTACPQCGGGLEQDADTLDTWFSSGTWTFSTLGWPDKKATDLATYHPTDVLETGYDILFFWVARMILMTTYAVGQVPFRTVYLHGLVRDEKNRKMSKSLGNVIDPLDVIAKYGTDAVRLSLLMGQTPGNDTKLSEEKIAGFRNFTNKLWNIARFVQMQGSYQGASPDEADFTTLDKWILSRLARTTNEVTTALERYEFSRAGELLRDFTWDDFADWYLEGAKVEGGKHGVAHFVLRNLLKLWHPFMPFVTEVLWQEAYATDAADLLLVAAWPSGEEMTLYPEAEKEFAQLREVVGALRALRAEHGIVPKDIRPAKVFSKQRDLAASKPLVDKLSRCEVEFAVSGDPAGGWLVKVLEEAVVAVEPVGVVLADHDKIQQEIVTLQHYADAVASKLRDREFVSKAPARVVDNEKKKLAEVEEKIAKLHKQIL